MYIKKMRTPTRSTWNGSKMKRERREVVFNVI